MPAIIPVQFEDVSDDYIGTTVVNRVTFVLPSLSRKCTADFVSSRTSAAIKRINRIIDMEKDGAEASRIVAAVNFMFDKSKRSRVTPLSVAELEEFKRVNGWIIEEQSAPVADIPAAVESGINEGMTDTRADIENAPVVTSDGRYIVDPVALTIEPVADIPADIVAIMPEWTITLGDKNSRAAIEFWPRSFDIAPDMEGAFEVEQEAAAALLIELGGIIWGACSTDIALDSLGNTARLIDSGKIIGPAGSYPAAAKPVGGA